MSSGPVSSLHDRSPDCASWLDVSEASPDLQYHETRPQSQGTHRPKSAFSEWSVGWKISLMMLALYFFAILIELTHFLFFKFLDGKIADREHSIPQSYTAAASNLLASSFRASLCGALSVAFTQHLWKILRSGPVRIDTIGRLFTIRQNFLLLGFPGVLKTTTALFTLALFSWLVPLAVIYPPGALTVIPAPFPGLQNFTVHTFNANNSINSSDATTTGLAYFDGFYYSGSQLQLRWISKLALQSGQISTTSSPRGNNCSFTVRFIGPYLQCDESTFNYTTMASDAHFFDYYSASWDGPKFEAEKYPSTLLRFGTFSMTLTRPLGGFQNMSLNSSYHQMVLFSSKRISCRAGSATFSLDTTYTSGSRDLTCSTHYIGPLRDIMAQQGFYAVSNATDLSSIYAFQQNAKYFIGQAIDLFAVIDSMFEPLAGYYPARVVSLTDESVNDGTERESVLVNGSMVTLYLSDLAFYATSRDQPNVTIEPNRTIIAETRFDSNRDNFMAIGPDLAITQDGLNKARANITLSIMYTYSRWNTSTTATTTKYSSIYSFSSVKNLVYPYTICLLLALPFLLLGAHSLHQNGVPAIDGGFLQVLTTITRSRRLEIAAARGCFGGDENIPQELLEMKVIFGELIENGEGIVKRAGFGTEDEVVPLRRGKTYGTHVS